MKSPNASTLVWWYAFGYFAAYVPYSALTKLLSSGGFPGVDRAIDGFELLPVTTLASLFGMFAFVTLKGWWHHARTIRVLGFQLPFPTRYTFLSGLATAGIIATTTLAYTFSGASIVFMMLLMRGGVLVIAPIVDLASHRRVKVPSWLALGLSVAALLVAVSGGVSTAMTLTAMLDVLVYLASYFVRLRLMTKIAKSDDRDTSLRYFVEEQMVATPAIVAFLALLAVVGQGEAMLSLRAGFAHLGASGYLAVGVVIGLCSQGTGIFGGLILLDKRENAFCVPVNRASSVIAGVVAALAITLIDQSDGPSPREFLGVGLLLVALVVLGFPELRAARAAAKAKR